ncbi:MAG: hypothetical protein KC983_03820 [Phycisphaerales bacterium]|nr:hypothetical protein [Phycisphaerales bacterium]
MRISGSLPFNVAQAYGVRGGKGSCDTCQTPAVQKISTVRPATGDDDPAAHVRSLVGGSVNAAVQFDGASTQPVARTGAFTLYTRAADTIEAATSIALGRQLDVRG